MYKLNILAGRNGSHVRCILTKLTHFIYLTLIFTIILLMPRQIYSQSESPQEQLIKAQIENENAQAKFYKSQTAPKSAWQNWSQLIIGLAGSLVGAGAALGGIYLTNRARRRDEEIKENRLAVAELSRNLAAGIQAISWLTWMAKNEALSKDHILEYTAEMKNILPGIVGARSVLAALYKPAHERMSGMVQSLYDLDASIGQLVLSFRDNPKFVREQLTEKHAVTLKYEIDLTTMVDGILN